MNISGLVNTLISWSPKIQDKEKPLLSIKDYLKTMSYYEEKNVINRLYIGQKTVEQFNKISLTSASYNKNTFIIEFDSTQYFESIDPDYNLTNFLEKVTNTGYTVLQIDPVTYKFTVSEEVESRPTFIIDEEVSSA